MKLFLSIFIPVAILGGLITWRMIGKHAETAAQAQMMSARAHASPHVSVAVAQIRHLKTTFEATGSLEAPLNVQISPKLQGRIEYLTVHEGDRVHKGQVLVRIDDSMVQADVRNQQGQLAEAQYKLAQTLTTEAPTNVGVKTQIAQQAAAVSSAQADYDQARQNYKAQVATAEDAVSDAQGRVDTTQAAIGNAKAGINSAQAMLTDDQTKLNRILDLWKQGYIAAQDVDDAKAALAVQQAALEAAQQQLVSAQAAHDSALAQKREAVQQVSIVQATGAANVEDTHQKLAQAKSALEYAKSNTAQTPAYRQGIQALQAAVAAQKAALASARSHVVDTVLVSPLDGYVTNRYMDPGTMATPGQPILGIQFFKQVWVSVAVPDDVSERTHLGQMVDVKFDALPGRTFSASVIQINPSAAAQGRQFTVRAILSNDQNLFRPGMFAHVTFTTSDSGPVVTVPREAVQHNAALGDYVNVVGEQDAIHQQSVKVGPSDATYLGLLSGLQAGDKVVTLCTVPLKEGQTVKIGDGRAASGVLSGAPAEGPGASTSAVAPAASAVPATSAVPAS
jgi:membrane fusion protein (multidrug efflux system)